MKWKEVRKLCPDTYVLLEEIQSHIIHNEKHVEEVALIRTIDDAKEATRELARSKGKRFVYHTANEEIEMEIVRKLGYKGAIRHV